MVWIQFILSAAVVVFTANKLAEYGDIIAVRTKLGGVFVGTIFLAGATSLPEMVASISAFKAGVPNLAAGNFFGSNMVNVVLIALVDLINFQVPLLRRVAVNHALTAALTSVLMLVAIIAIMGHVNIAIGWVGIDSLLLIILYFGGVWLIQREGRAQTAVSVAVEPGPEFPSLWRGIIGFVIAATVLILIVPLLVSASTGIATITGLGTGFVGTALLSVVTSLPELIAALAAMRMNAFDMAVGNLFGSSVFNMLALGLSDFFFVDGRFLEAIDENFILVGLLGLLLTNMALVGNLARVERKFLFIELDAVAIIIVYLLGMYLLFIRGIGL
ncbi:MAG: sodium:calcium antiporter [Ardenticatenaceae bacterium]|nr:sodium:calcium antiporter [Ardenticatenaceae bacterium]